MNVYTGDNFDKLYGFILKDLIEKPDHTINNRKGENLYELFSPRIELTNLDNCYAFCRNMDFKYLVGGLLFYLKGENKLSNIVKYSKFWEKVSDDGVNLNSCYGYYIWKMKTSFVNYDEGAVLSQFDYCVNSLKNNKYSKKAVITVYDGNIHSYRTNDNPCTMYMQFFIRDNKLNLLVNMRNNDVWFSLPYDLPFFIFVQKMMYYKLLETYYYLELGTYYHISNSLHLYERNVEKAREALYFPIAKIDVPTLDEAFFKNYGIETFMEIEEETKDKIFKHPFNIFAQKLLLGACSSTTKYLKEAWEASELSSCLKKKVGCVIVIKDNEIISRGWNGRPSIQGACKECVRKTETFLQDDCNSIHSEQRAIFNCPDKDSLQDSTIYITHAPCDQCMKFLLYMGIKKVVYDNSYKTDFTRYKGLIEVFEKDRRII